MSDICAEVDDLDLLTVAGETFQVKSYLSSNNAWDWDWQQLFSCYQIEFYLGGDWKFLAMATGIDAASSTPMRVFGASALPVNAGTPPSNGPSTMQLRIAHKQLKRTWQSLHCQRRIRNLTYPTPYYILLFHWVESSYRQLTFVYPCFWCFDWSCRRCNAAGLLEEDVKFEQHWQGQGCACIILTCIPVVAYTIHTAAPKPCSLWGICTVTGDQWIFFLPWPEQSYAKVQNVDW